MTRSSRRRHVAPRSSGMTLIELLIVVGILVSLTAALIPAVKPAFEGRKTREAARQVSAYFAGAKARAAALGRPVGVAIQRLNPGSNSAMQLYMVEEPAPYRGDESTARAAVTDITVNNFGWVGTLWLTDSARLLTQIPALALVRPGDEIQLGYQGHRYEIRSIAPYNVANEPDGPQVRFTLITFTSLSSPAPRVTELPALTWEESGLPAGEVPPNTERLTDRIRAGGLPFTIYRRPRKSSAQPLELPNGVVIDLANSGFHLTSRRRIPMWSWNFASVGSDGGPGVANRDDNGDGFVDDSGESGWAGTDDLLDDLPIMIMFDPKGSVERVYWLHPDPFVVVSPNDAIFRGDTVSGSLYFMIGKADKVVPTGERAAQWSESDTIGRFVYNDNLVDNSNLWVSVRIGTGNVATAENNWGQDQQGNPTFPFFLDAFNASREFARTAIGMGGG